MEAWKKFHATTITRQVRIFFLPFLSHSILFGCNLAKKPTELSSHQISLDVGRTIFHFLNRVEIFMAVLLLLDFQTLFHSHPSLGIYVLIPMLILAIQAFLWQPALDQRAIIIINGGVPSSSNVHLLYVFTEVVKELLLFATSYYVFAALF
jgi:hypothetical protein